MSFKSPQAIGTLFTVPENTPMQTFDDDLHDLTHYFDFPTSVISKMSIGMPNDANAARMKGTLSSRDKRHHKRFRLYLARQHETKSTHFLFRKKGASFFSLVKAHREYLNKNTPLSLTGLFLDGNIDELIWEFNYRQKTIIFTAKECSDLSLEFTPDHERHFWDACALIENRMRKSKSCFF